MKGKSKNCWWVTLHQCVEYCSFSCSMIRLHHDTGDYTTVTIQTERQLLEGEWQEHCVCCLFSCLCVSVSIQQQFLYLTAGSYCIILSVYYENDSMHRVMPNLTETVHGGYSELLLGTYMQTTVRALPSAAWSHTEVTHSLSVSTQSQTREWGFFLLFCSSTLKSSISHTEGTICSALLLKGSIG